MKTSRFSDAQLLPILKQAGDAIPVAQLCREHRGSQPEKQLIQ